MCGPEATGCPGYVIKAQMINKKYIETFYSKSSNLYLENFLERSTITDHHVAM